MTLLSILVPSYQREDLLSRLASTAPVVPRDCEILVGVDGGGYDATRFPALQVVNLGKEGRFGVIKVLARDCKGKYVMISDDDDFFLPGQLELLMLELRDFDRTRQTDEIGLLLKCDYLNKPRPVREHLMKAGPMDILEPLFRWNIKSDYKQVVDANVCRDALSKVNANAGRVPTSLLWLYCGDYGKVRYRPVSVMVKDYLQGGLSTDVKKKRIRGRSSYQQFYVEALRRVGSRKFGSVFGARCVLSLLYSYRKFSG